MEKAESLQKEIASSSSKTEMMTTLHKQMEAKFKQELERRERTLKTEKLELQNQLQVRSEEMQKLI